MEIRELRRVTPDRGVRAEADLVWEDADLATRTLWFETEAACALDYSAIPDGFKLACMDPSAWPGARRVRQEAPVCHVMRDNAVAVARLLHQAHPHATVPELQVDRGFAPGTPRRPSRTGMFLSGGVDALSVLRRNRLDYPLDHPEAIRDAYLGFGLYGFDVTEDGPVPERLAAWGQLRARMAGLAERQSLTLVPFLTNVRTFAPDYLSWSRALFTPLTAACVHGFADRVSSVRLGSDGSSLEPGDVSESQTLSQCLSTAALELRLDLLSMDRLARIGLLADWDEGRALMQPCHWVEVPTPGQINCGRCEKCVRTMLGLVVHGRLADASAFDADDLTPDVIEEIRIPSRNKLEHLTLFVRPQLRAGRRDLAQAIRERARRFDRKGR